MKHRALPGEASGRMSRQASQDTGPELAVRSELHRRGLRYFVHRQPVKGLRRKADLVFPVPRIAVFIDGCFWHGCPEHRSYPKRNADYWEEKIELNQTRDADTSARLVAEGWTVIRVWEHEPPSQAADRIEAVVRASRRTSRGLGQSLSN